MTDKLPSEIVADYPHAIEIHNYDEIVGKTKQAERALIERAEKAEALVPRWIPVTEEFPEYGVRVLVI